MTKTYNEGVSPTVIVPPPGERYRETQGPIIVTAKKFSKGGAHCVVVKDWIGDYVTAVLEKDKDKTNDPTVEKVVIFVTQFGNGALRFFHLSCFTHCLSRILTWD